MNVLSGPVISEFSGIIASQPGKPIKSVIEILHVIKAFSRDFYLFLAVTICSTLIIMGHKIRKNNKLTNYLIKYFKRILKHTWYIFGLVVDQASYCNAIHNSRILWVSVALATFVVMHGFMMNLVSTDLTVEISPPRISSIDDLSTPYFNSVGIHIYADSPEYAALRDAPINSTLNKLFRNRIEERDKSNVNVSIKFHETLGLLRVGKVVHILNTDAWNNAVKLLSCCYKPINNMDLIVSKSFVSSTLLSLFSTSADSKLKEYIEQRVMIVFEGNLMVQELKQYAIESFRELGFEYDWNAMRCDKKLIEVFDNNLPILQIPTLYSTLKLCKVMIAISIVVLAFENLSKLLKPKSRRKNLIFVKRILKQKRRGLKT